MQLTVRGLLVVLVAAPLIAVAAWLPVALWVAGGWLLFVAAFLIADAWLMPATHAWQLVRRHDARLSLAAQNLITVQVELFTRAGRSGRPVAIWLRDTPPPTFHLDRAEPLLTGVASPGSSCALTYHVWPPRRGDYAFGDLYLRWASPLGFLRRQARFAAAGPVKVYPNLIEVRKYDLLLRRNRLWELGLRSTRLLGAGNEFERLRDYTPDDEYRRINWMATARRGKPISVEYETERSQNIYVLLDVGRMMRSPVGDVAKMDYAINAVLLLAYVAAQKGDRIALLTFADRVLTYVAPRSGKIQFHRLLEQLYAVHGEGVEPDYGVAFSEFAARQHKRGLALVFTDLTGSVTTEALVTQMARLRRQHLPLLVTVADPTVNRLATAPITDGDSLYTRTVAERMLAERRLTLDQLRRQGVQTLDVPADELSVAVINRYLAMKERLLI
ncbi:DUF58 domain-containing protein [Caldilinea sp.]|uniref:DUF58 domain-containing protein n=1 Tax=Caldilinea sp. TaxID=2293560 RepID=UPI002BCD8AF0|nr:DUF58 domain-containing protein [Caldilinea sp.]HRA65380.1 DUF58 domain-containing protein [Caldilinea sp.]